MPLCGLKDYKALFSFLFLLWTSPALAAIAIVNTPSAFNTSSAAAPSYTYNFQCNGGTDALLVIIHSYGSYDNLGATHQSATFNGVAATLQSGAGAGIGNEDLAVYTQSSPATGAAHDFIVTYSANAPSFGAYIQAQCLSGTNTSSLVGQTAAHFDLTASSPIGDTIASASDSLVFDAMTTNTTATFTVGGGQTQLYNTSWGGGGALAMSSDKLNGTTMQWTYTGTAPRAAHGVIEIKAAGAPPAISVRHRRVQ